MNRLELKIQALKERIGQLTVDYEDKDAERRVEITELAQQNEELKQQVQQLTEQVEALSVPTETEENGPEVERDSTGDVPSN